MSRHKPPGPSELLLGLDQLPRVRRDLLGFYTSLHQTYGDAVRVRLGPYVQHIFFHPDQIKEVLATKADRFVKIKRARAVLSQWDGNGLVLSEGAFWQRQRRLMQPAFHHDRVRRYGDTMVAITARLRDEWHAGAARRGYLDVDVNDAMTALTLNIASETLFGADISGETARLGEAIAVLSDEAVKELQEPVTLPRWLPLPRVRRKWAAIDLLDTTVREIIRERRASTNGDRGDLLSMLLEAVDEEHDGGQMTDEQVRDETITLFLAGHDTSAAGLIWLWHNLARHPEVLERATAEVDSLGSRLPTAADLKQLPYLETVLKETLRLHPPAIGVFTREAIGDVEIGGYQLKRGHHVQLISFVTQRDPRWFPEPERFDPERFAPGRAESLPQYSYFPFGAGPRVCIGRQFALTEMLLVAATMLQTLRPAPQPGAPVSVELLPQLSLRPKGGLPLRWTARTQGRV
jgi:cytochrome P450